MTDNNKTKENEEKNVVDTTSVNDEHATPHIREKMHRNFLRRAREASLVRKIVVVMIILMSVLVYFGGRYVFDYLEAGLNPVDPDSNEEVLVDIPMGSSSSTIAEILEDHGIIDNALIYRVYIKVNNVTGFQAGEYSLSPAMTLEEVSAELLSGRVLTEALYTVTIPEGRTLEEIAVLLENSTGIDQEEFLEQMNDDAYIQSLIERFPLILSEEILDNDIRYPLEGYLFAATYPIYEETPSIDTVVTQMLDKTEDVIRNYYNEIDELGEFSIHELLTFSSIVEREARNEEERRLISGVFYNRLEEGMRLETDPTVIYAIGEHVDRVLFSHLEIDSPYNTYRIFGLPIGPISNFGESSLRAVLDPEDTNYLFFVAAPDGTIYYSETFEEHRRLANEHLDRDV